MGDAGGADLVLVLTTVADAATGERLVGTLVDERLIACGNLVPGVLSLYRWQGEPMREEEVLVLMKTAPARVPELFARVEALHPYEVPELVALPVAAASSAYCRWVGNETTEVSA